MTDSNQTSIQSSLQETRRFNPPEQFQRQARVQSMDEYRQIWQRSIDDPETFWAEQADELRWQKRWDKVLNWHEPYAEWFVGGKINASENCLDRIIASGRGDKVAILFEGEPVDDDGKPVEVRNLTYNDVLAEVCRFANGLKSIGVKKGDVVTLYMPMVPEAAIAMLACARIGAAHSVIFGGFSAQAIADRVDDAKSKFVITADGGYRRGKVLPLV